MRPAPSDPLEKPMQPAETPTPPPSVLTHGVGSVRVITLNRPEKLNAANLDMQQRLVVAIEKVAADPEIRVLILTGAGRAFSAGGDRDIVEAKVAGQLDRQVDLAEALAKVHVDTIQTLLKLEIPAIAAVNGLAVGYSAGVVALCDMVVMAEDSFLSDPHVRFGIGATTATQLMWPRLASMAAAKEILMSGRKVYAEEAVRLGLANKSCPSGKAFDEALLLAEQFTQLPRKGIAETKRRFNRDLIRDVEALLIPEG
jgi:enoyl-CoA hydratase